LGFAPELIIAEPENIWLALVLSESISLEDGLSVICSGQPTDQISFKRPRIPIKTSVDNQVVSPLEITEDYINFLFEHPIANRKMLERLVNTARLIINSQYSFRQLIKEWDTELEAYDWSIETLLFDDDMVNSDMENRQVEKLIILITIQTSLKKLHLKWQLSEEDTIGEELQEIVDLIIDGIVTKGDFLKLIFKREKDLSKLTKVFNARQHLVDLAKSYTFLRHFSSQRISEVKINSLSTGNDILWFKKLAGDVTHHVKHDEMKCFRYGETLYSVKENTTIVYPDDEQETKTFEDVLRQMWLEGVNIKWNQTNTTLLAKKVPLPTYEFVQKPFWLVKNSRKNQSKREIPLERDQETILKLIDLFRTNEIDENIFIQRLKTDFDYASTEKN
jgi:acyl transferase domain-containing protein